MRSAVASFNHAWQGICHALATERNLQLFLGTYILILILGYMVTLQSWEWTALMLSGGGFLVTELLNTALERLVDAVDDIRRKEDITLPRHAKLKATKDVASSASLVALGITGIVILMIFVPRMF